MHECTHLCTHLCTHTHTHTYTHTHMHTHMHTHRDWACTTCSDFGFLFLTLFSQSVHVHDCVHTYNTCTHTYTHILGLYHLHSFYNVYMCMNVHTCAHTLLCKQPVYHIFVTHTHSHTVHMHCYGNGILCTIHTYTHVQYTCTHTYHEKH